MGAAKHPRHQQSEAEADVDHERLGEDAAVRLSLAADDRQLGEPGNRHLVDGAERRPTLGELGLEDERRSALARERDGDADNDLVEAPADAEEHHHERDTGSCEHAGAEAEPLVAAVVGGDEARVGTHQHHPLEADVEHAAALRHELAEAGE